jgi:hypothetical protein
MTDDLEPQAPDPTPGDDATSRLPAWPGPSAPTVPLTPVSRPSLPPQTFEHEVAWASAAPAVQVVTATTPRRRSRGRWAISIVVIALVMLTSAAVVLLITGRSSTATILGYVPDDSIVYGEVRLDLPGDQRQAVGGFLSKFPGFADQAALDTKLDEVLDNLVKDATKGDQSYTLNIKPWFDGELGFSMDTLPPAASISGGDPSASGAFRGLALVSIKDTALAQAWFDAAIAKAGAKTTKETYNGTTLTVFEKTGGITAALGLIDGKVAIAGDIVSVKAAVDSRGASKFASTPGPKAAIDSATGDYVGFVYVGLRPLTDWSNELNRALPKMGGLQSAGISGVMLQAIPDWGTFWLRVESDAIVVEAVAPKPETQIGPTENRSSTVVEHIPGSAIVAFNANDYGKTLTQTLALYRSEPTLKPMLDQLDQALGLVGGADAALGWAGDTAAVISDTDGGFEGGLIVAPTDKAAAAHLFTALRAFIAIGGGQQGLTVRDETYNGTTITIVDLGDIRALSGAAGAASGLPLPTGHVEISYAVTDNVVVIGCGPGFVKHVLDTTPATSLASNERYKKLVGRAGTGIGTTFVDITAIREQIEKAASGSADAVGLAKYEQNVKPFLVPFDALVATGSVNSDTTRSVIYITVK